MMAPSYWLLLLLYVISPPYRTIKACYNGCSCLSDMKYVNCSGVNLTTPLKNIPPITDHLDMSRNLLTGLQKGSFGTLWCLRVLLLNDNNIRNVADGAFSTLQELRKLELSHNCLADLGPGFSLGLESLTELLLDHNHLTYLDSGSFNSLENLQKLDLSSNLISTVKPRALGYLTSLRQLHLEGNHLTSLGSGLFSTLRSLEVLGLRGNLIRSTEPGTFSPMSSLNLLDLAHNRLSTLTFRTLLSITTPSLHVLLEGNPWHCDCDLQRVFRKLCSIHRVFLDDYRELRCSKPLGLKGRSMREVDDELCVGETVTVLILTITVVITVVAAIIMAEKNKKNSVAKDCEESMGLDTYYDNES